MAWNFLKGLFGNGGSDEDGEQFRLQSAAQQVVSLPDVDDLSEVDVRYPLLKPFARAHITWDDDQDELLYQMEEPELDEEEQEIFDNLKDALERKIDISIGDLETDEELVEYLASRTDNILDELGYHISESSRQKILYFVYRNFAGINEIEPLMHDPYIEDIGCSGTGIPIYVVHSKFGSIKTDLVFEDEERLKRLVVKLAERCGKYISYSEPLLDGALPDGSRVNASLTEDVTTKGPTFSIRKFQEVPYSAVDLLDLGTVNLDIVAYFWMLLQYQKSVLISGGTAAGKTSFLNAIVAFIPPEKKIVSIEDTRELQLPHENWIPSVARSGFGDEETDIDMFRLLKESFRQNPDYVIVGEVRGEEASVLFQGMSSGHPSIGTIHASSPHEVVKRLTTSPIDLSPSLVETLDSIVIMTKASQHGENSRRVKSIHEVEAVTPEGSPRTNEYISWTPIDDTFSVKSSSNLLNEIRQQFGFTREELEEELENRKKVLKWMQDSGYTSFPEVSRIVSEYYKDKDKVLKAADEEMEGFETKVKGLEARNMAAEGSKAHQELVERKQKAKSAKDLDKDKNPFEDVDDLDENPFD